MDSNESFKLVSHSMGGAFSMGIKDYLEEQGWNVESAVFINAYQSDKIQMEENDSTFSVDFQNTNDPVLFWFDSNLGKGKIMNSEIKIRVESDRGFRYIHLGPVSSGEKFWEELQMAIRQQFE